MKKKIVALLLVFISLFIVSCDNSKNIDFEELYPKYDIYYQIFIRSFADSDGDGIGDFNGITENLDYLEDLGVTAIWLLPYNDTDTDWNSYHGYRVKNYYEVNSEYGTMEDLENLIQTAKSKGIKIVMDFVINHTADTHPWFIDAKKSNSPFRDYYIWLNDSTAFESFTGGMKDLNLNNTKVVEEIKNIIKFWIEKGIEGFRFDAVKHFFIGDPETHPSAGLIKNYTFLRELQNYAKTINPNIYFVGEMFEYDYLAYNQYYIGLDSLFDFYTADQIWSKIGKGTSIYQLTSNIKRAFDSYQKYNPNYIPAVFLSNHDIDRIASKEGYTGFNSLGKLKVSASLMLTLPGSPYVYYGDEIGMYGVRYEGDNLTGQGPIYDQYRRSPFLWGDSTYQTTWLNPYGNSHSSKSLKDQKDDENSLYNHYRTLMNLRKNTPALRYGNYFELWKDSKDLYQGYIRYFKHEDFEQALLIIHNLYTDSIELDVEYQNILYGSLNLEGYSTVILEIDPTKLNEYIK